MTSTQTHPFRPYKENIYGFSLAVASNTTLTIGAGTCSDAATYTADIITSAPITLNAAVNGINGLDTGSFAASTTYYVYAIGSSLNRNIAGVIMSLSATAPLMPINYDLYRRIGVAISDGSTYFIKLYQSGLNSQRTYTYDEAVQILAAGTQTSFTAISLAGKAPAVDNMVVNLKTYFTPASPGDTAHVRTGGSSATNGITVYGNVAAQVSSETVLAHAKLVTAVPTVEYKVSAGSLNASIVSFIDNI